MQTRLNSAESHDGENLGAVGVMWDRSGSSSATGLNTLPDPTSLADLSLVDGSTDALMTPGDIAAKAAVVVGGRVIDVRQSRLNTDDGRFPSGAALAQSGTAGLTVLTDVVISVETVPAGDTSLASAVQDLTLTVGGGAYRTDLDADQARALGILVPTETLPLRDDRDSGPPDVEVEVPADGPVSDYLFGSAPSAAMAEGDSVVVFLTEIDVPGYQGAAALHLLTPVHPDGVLHARGDGWTAGYTGGPLVDLGVLLTMVG